MCCHVLRYFCTHFCMPHGILVHTSANEDSQSAHSQVSLLKRSDRMRIIVFTTVLVTLNSQMTLAAYYWYEESHKGMFWATCGFDKPCIIHSEIYKHYCKYECFEPVLMLQINVVILLWGKKLHELWWIFHGVSLFDLWNWMNVDGSRHHNVMWLDSFLQLMCSSLLWLQGK